MIETIPDITKDKTFQADAEEYTDRVMRRCSNQSFIDYQDKVRKVIRATYMRGLSNGFRTGWKIQEQRRG